MIFEVKKHEFFKISFTFAISSAYVWQKLRIRHRLNKVRLQEEYRNGFFGQVKHAVYRITQIRQTTVGIAEQHGNMVVFVEKHIFPEELPAGNYRQDIGFRPCFNCFYRLNLYG